MALPQLIARKVLFGNPDRTGVLLSPDGEHLSYRAPLDGVMNVWIAPRERPEAARPLTRDAGRGIQGYFWAYTNRHILVLQDRSGDENWRVIRVDIASGETLDLTPLDGVQAQVLAVSPRRPTEVVVGLNDRDPRWHDAFRIDILSGRRELLLRNDGFSGIEIDDDFRPRLALRPRSDGGMDLAIAGDDGQWDDTEGIPPADVLTTHVLGFDSAGTTAFLRDSRGRNTSALVAMDLASRRRTLLAEDERADADEVLLHPSGGHPEAVAFTYDRQRWQTIDPAVAADLEHLQAGSDGEVSVVSRSLDDEVWIVVYRRDRGPARYRLYERRRREARTLFSDREALEGLPLAPMRPVVIRSRDGLDLVGYCTLPVGSDADGAPCEPLPMVFCPHGGPWWRDRWGLNPWHQWLANRGYAVLDVNFRASTGFGKAFVNAGDHEWGGAILDDQLDAVRWAIDAGIADPARVAILGGSFGGYSVLAQLTRNPEIFACGIDLVGPSNLITFIEAIPPYWEPLVELLATRVGDHRTPEGRALLERHSPLNKADRICRPLLIAQGANDPRVKQTESDQIVAVLQDKGIPVTYLLYPDEGHGFVRPENNLSFYAVAEAFLARHLGGRHEPIGDAFNGSSIQVLAGAADIPGLAAAAGNLPQRPGE